MPAPHGDDGDECLQPIPRFREIISETVGEVLGSGATKEKTRVKGRVVPIEVGVTCDLSMVRVVAQTLHLKVLKQLCV